MKRLAVLSFAFVLAACGGGGGTGGGGGITPTPPSGVITTYIAGAPAPITSSAANPINVPCCSGMSIDVTESGYTGNFTVTTSGPCLSVSPASAPYAFGFFPTGVICAYDGHEETATIRDSYGHTTTAYFALI